jgi:predicted negative regulator of RcsB-dependent stress response
MTKHPTGRRPGQDAAPDDAFIERVLQLSNWAQQNLATVVIGAVVLAVVVAGTLYYRGHQAERRTQAAIELMNLRLGAGQFEEEQLLRQLQVFVQRYDGTASADEARVLLGQTHLRLDQPAEAVAVLEPQARRPDRPLGAAAAFLLATAYEAQERPEDAEAVYLRIAERAEMSYQKREALDQAARLRLDRTDAAGAVALYERLIGTVGEGTPERAFYEMRLAEARAQATATLPASN